MGGFITFKITTMVKSFSFKLDDEFEVEEITDKVNVTYDESEEIISDLIESYNLDCGDRTEGTISLDDGVYNVKYRFLLDGEWVDFEKSVTIR